MEETVEIKKKKKYLSENLLSISSENLTEESEKVSYLLPKSLKKEIISLGFNIYADTAMMVAHFFKAQNEHLKKIYENIRIERELEEASQKENLFFKYLKQIRRSGHYLYQQEESSPEAISLGTDYLAEKIIKNARKTFRDRMVLLLKEFSFCNNDTSFQEIMKELTEDTNCVLCKKKLKICDGVRKENKTYCIKCANETFGKKINLKKLLRD